MPPEMHLLQANDDQRMLNLVEPYVRALGQDGALAFLTQFGGGLVNIPTVANRKCKLAGQIGHDKVARLVEVFGGGQLKVPQCKRWVAHRLDDAGVPRQEISRRLHVTRETVRLYFVKQKPRAEGRA